MLWWPLRYMMVLLASAVVTLLLLGSKIGTALFWLLAIPGVPLLLIVAPGVWRNICPIAFFNQLPRILGISAGRALPDFVREHAYLISIVGLLSLVYLRQPLLNHNAMALAAMLIALFGAAFIGGMTFRGKSGWCGTFCPMSVLERTYGMSPIAVVRNTYCAPCLSCQKNCYDQNAEFTIFKDFDDANSHFSGHRKLFVGALPGLIYWYFATPHSFEDSGVLVYTFSFLQHALLSYGLFHIFAYLLPRHVYQTAMFFATSSIAIFYWKGAPLVQAGLAKTLEMEIPNIAVLGVQLMAIIAAFASLVRGIQTAESLKEATTATDAKSGREFAVTKNLPLLDSIIAADVPIKHQCRMGMCGSDVIMIREGEDNLAPPTETELATLRRMGLEGKARLACMCHAKGPVTLEVAGDEPRAEPATPELPPAPVVAAAPAAAPDVGWDPSLASMPTPEPRKKGFTLIGGNNGLGNSAVAPAARAPLPYAGTYQHSDDAPQQQADPLVYRHQSPDASGHAAPLRHDVAAE